jgi:hypothetical protein
MHFLQSAFHFSPFPRLSVRCQVCENPGSLELVQEPAVKEWAVIPSNNSTEVLEILAQISSSLFLHFEKYFHPCKGNRRYFPIIYKALSTKINCLHTSQEPVHIPDICSEIFVLPNYISAWFSFLSWPYSCIWLGCATPLLAFSACPGISHFSGCNSCFSSRNLKPLLKQFFSGQGKLLM